MNLTLAKNQETRSNLGLTFGARQWHVRVPQPAEITKHLYYTHYITTSRGNKDYVTFTCIFRVCITLAPLHCLKWFDMP